MTKIIVMSDSHGAEENVNKLLTKEGGSDWLVHLGDGVDDYFESSDNFNRKIVRVCGNCDRFTQYSENVTLPIEKLNFYFTHGYREGVKYNLSRLYYTAKEHNCTVALFGHTHQKLLEQFGGVYLFNPGSLHGGSYGVITVDGEEISFDHKNIYD